MGKSFKRSSWEDDETEFERVYEANNRRAKKKTKRTFDSLEKKEEDR